MPFNMLSKLSLFTESGLSPDLGGAIRENFHFNKNFSAQSGRSMIEMLGVLAIIGVLSIGGIAGYSKAMTKYRINKLADQITQLAQNIRTLYASQKNYSSLSDDVVKKAHLAPDELYENSSSSSMRHAFGGTISVYSCNDKSFCMNVYSGSFGSEACIDLLTRDWGQGSSSGLVGIRRWGGYSDALTYGCTASNNNYHCAMAGVMPIDIAMQMCTSNDIVWVFR